jgi:hypothetical protein
MGQLTLMMQQHNGLPSITNIYFNEIDAITELEDHVAKRMTNLSVEASFKEGQCINIHVDDKDLKKIIKQGYLYAAFDYHPNNNGYGIPLVIKSSKSGLVKAFKANHDPEATEFTMFRDCFNAAAFTLDKNNIPVGFTGYRFYGLKIS